MHLVGNNGIILRTVKITDADFILSLRINPDLNKYLSLVNANLDDQINFIKNYQKKEEAGLEYYFIIESENEKIGTVRIYDLDYKNSVFTWGSWIIIKGMPIDVALSSAYMIYDFGFNYLNFKKSLIDVRKENLSVFKFHKSYAKFLKEDELNYYLELEKSDLANFSNRFKNKIPDRISVLKD